VDFSDYFIEGDLFDILPELTESLEKGELDLKAVADGGSVSEANGTSSERSSDGGPESAAADSGGDADD
jgi:hypothetical protein